MDTIVIGAGQAGLATSFSLTQKGRDHLVLERGRIGEAWRTRRWDSFTLVGPNWSSALPGKPYSGYDPDGFMHRDDLVGLFQSYARSFRAPVREGVEVRRLRWDAGRGRFVVDADGETFVATRVVIATGPYQRRKIPADAKKLDPSFTQLHTDEYRSPGQLPDGGVLVVGSGQSGCQIAEELREAGRDVYLSTGHCGWFPRRYRGKDNMWWRNAMGFFESTVDTLPSPRARLDAVPIQTGKDGGRDLNLRILAAKGVILAGRFAGAEGTRAWFQPDLDENLARSDKVARELIWNIDGFIRERGIDAPKDDQDLFFAARIARVDELDLARARISTVLWATGYTLDFGWVELPLFEEDGYPIQRQGVTDYPGLYFVGLHWMHTRKSGLIFGVGEDAQHIVEHLDGAQGA